MVEQQDHRIGRIEQGLPAARRQHARRRRGLGDGTGDGRQHRHRQDGPPHAQYPPHPAVADAPRAAGRAAEEDRRDLIERLPHSQKLPDQIEESAERGDLRGGPEVAGGRGGAA